MEVQNENDLFKAPGARNLLLVDEKDQSHIISRIKDGKYGECFFFSEEHDFSDLMNEMMQPSLFGDKKVMIVLECASYTDSQWAEIFTQDHCMCFFFKKSAVKALVDRFKASGNILRLTAEKPWDRKSRLLKEVVYSISKMGVQISQPVAHRFVERVFNDLQLFHGELDKLKMYARGMRKIEESDIDAIVKPLPEENLFKVSEEIVWKGAYLKNFTLDGVSGLLQLIGSFRFQAHLGLKILSRDDVKLPPWQEKRYKQKALAFGDAFFKKILTLSYQAERRAKQSSVSAEVVFDILSLEIIALFSKNQAAVNL